MSAANQTADPAGETTTGEITGGQSTDGQSTDGQSPTGDTTTGETATGETATGQSTTSETATGQTVTGQTTAGQAIVETNNLHQVIQHFDNSGELIDNKIRIKIECQICMCKDLALANQELDPLDKESHESYAVLPRCGHAFGHSCLQRWIKTQRAQRNYDPKCPSCRTPLLCEKMHALTLTEIGFMGRGSKTQAEDLVGVRNTLQMADCSRCLTRREEYERAMAQLPEAERIARRNEMPEWIESQQRAVDGLIRLANGTEEHNQIRWNYMEGLLASMHAIARDRSQRHRPTHSALHLAMFRRSLEDSVTRHRNRSEGTSIQDWERVEVRISHLEAAAEAMIERERMTGNNIQMVEAQVVALEATMRQFFGEREN